MRAVTFPYTLYKGRWAPIIPVEFHGPRGWVPIWTYVDSGASFSILATLNEAYKAAQLNRNALSAGHAYYLATRGTARALYLEDRIGSIATGMEADLVVLDMRSTPLIDFRMNHARDFSEQLFIQMILGDDRAVQATYVAGRPAYARPSQVTDPCP